MDPIEPLYAPQVREELLARAEAQAGAYATAFPFPHAMFDNFLPADLLEQALAVFPRPGDVTWHKFQAEKELKLAFDDLSRLPEVLRNLIQFLNGPTILQFLERLTGIEGLLPDPYLNGGGLHQLERGGFLKIHADFNKIMRAKLLRRVNLLLYLNKDWKEEYDGHLELWNTDMTQRGARILPIFNRCVVFNTTSDSYHGNPEPLTCPEGWTRKSIALYYYVADVGATSTLTPHSTLWQEPQAPPPPPNAAKALIKRLTPPIVLDAWRSLKR